ncbi:MAG: 3-hydroxyacyl-ACP dehydratase FabZ [Pseudomonadota bacterium]|uniref:3-hydroxyacyl-[acyl-carrier-protein] dehydratase FabZ n=1 Tax=Candidatus Desulfatibia profunda TaxID=2841695 RepID=A0A8J6TME5_9BACT|nr:3-hydroxyacyl-ACP dehydratase FabZ [Candidatus Desulfatibia profunda]MBL7181130.1 3-hydroxyacyl-ACP dehydratase FabZ [Desulfobacterales bacterium]
MEKTYDIQKIMKILPHRYPFIMIDRILELVPGEKVVALKNVTINEPFFQGHFPGDPIMPGVLIIEAMGQAGAVLAAESMNREREGTLIYFMAMDKVKFRKPVVPGDQLIFKMQFLKQRSQTFKMSGIAFVDDKRVAEAELMATFGERT